MFDPKIMPDVLNQAWQLGYSDCVADSMLLREVCNPFGLNDPRWTAYEDGWQAHIEDLRYEYI